MRYLNLGCGSNYSEEWTNLDMVSNSQFVKSHNLLKGIPYQNAEFHVVYHSHVLEHFSKDDGVNFMSECFRVLKPGGIIRVVVPDLENMVKEYLKLLKENINNPSKMSEANYEWIMLEMYDQCVRTFSGGYMAKFLEQQDHLNERYIKSRIGSMYDSIRKNAISKKKLQNKDKLKQNIKKKPKIFIRKMKNIFSTSAKSIAKFRTKGEIHMWMYDRYSLSLLLKRCGFDNIEIKTPTKSNIPQWDKYNLDLQYNSSDHSSSLFMEATKPI